MKNILISTDFSAHADRALEKAVFLATEHSATLHLLHVTHFLSRPQWWERDEDFLRKEAENLAHAHLKSYPAAAKLDVVVHIVEGDAFAEIIGLAQKLRVDLIVMGLHNKTSMPDLFVGTTIERVIRKGTQPVLMVKDKHMGAYQKVAAAVDFSQPCQNALQVAARIAPHSTFQLLHFYDVPFSGFLADEQSSNIVHQESLKRLDAFLGSQADLFAEYDITTETVHRAASVIPGILATVEEHHTQLLAMGTHTRSGIGNALLGSTAQAILANPPCDVLVAGDMAFA